MRDAPIFVLWSRAEMLFTFRRHIDVWSLHFGFELPNASAMQLYQDSGCAFVTRLEVE
jgi:hypothetical protein